ncbi:MAG: hypothetical protein KGN34_01515 [Sphingomonadales bacterium]|nr:hypothetical protein [Sphingomonadales bacterium]
MRRLLGLVALPGALLAAPAAARDSLGMFEGWGAFRDAQVPRCYAIAIPEKPGGSAKGWLDVGNWPKRGLRGRVHLRLSKVPVGAAPRLAMGAKRFELVAQGADAWPRDARDEAAILAAMRSSASLTVSARAGDGHLFTDSYRLAGAASAMDSALVGCAG